VTNRLFTVNIHRNVVFWITYLYKLIDSTTACVQDIACMHALRRARHFVNQGRSQEFATAGGQKRGSEGGRKSLSGVQGQSPGKSQKPEKKC